MAIFAKFSHPGTLNVPAEGVLLGINGGRAQKKTRMIPLPDRQKV